MIFTERSGFTVKTIKLLECGKPRKVYVMHWIMKQCRLMYVVYDQMESQEMFPSTQMSSMYEWITTSKFLYSLNVCSMYSQGVIVGLPAQNTRFRIFRFKMCCLQIFSLKQQVSMVTNDKIMMSSVLQILKNLVFKSSVLIIPQIMLTVSLQENMRGAPIVVVYYSLIW